MRDGFVSKEELLSILDEQSDSRQQRITGRRLGEILINRGVVTPTEVARLVAEQYELPFVDLDVTDIDLPVAQLLTEELARRYMAVAISSRPDGSVLLAIGDPGTVVFSDELRRALGVAPRFAVVGPDAIEAALDYVYTQTSPEPERPVVHASDDGVVVEMYPSAETSETETPASELYLGTQRTAAHLWPPLGALLIREGLISDAELEAALAQQRLSANRRLGEILVDRGSVTRDAVARLVAEQYELPYVDFSAEDLDPVVSALLPEEIARRYTALPIRFLPEGSVQVVVADPTNILHSDEIHRALGRPLTVAVAAPDSIEAAIASVYRQVQVIPLAPPAPPVAEDEPASHADVVVDATPSDDAVEEPALETSEQPVHALTEVEPVEAFVESDQPEAADEAPRAFAEDLAEVLLAETNVADAWTDDLELVEETAAERTGEVRRDPEQAEVLAEPTFEAVSWIETAELDIPFDLTSAPEVAAVASEQATDEAAAEPSGWKHADAPDIFGYFPPLPEAVDATLLAADADEEIDEEVPATEDVQAAESAEAAPDVEAAIARALELGASSIHFSPHTDELVVRARVDGALREIVRMPRTENGSLAQSVPTSDDVRADVLPTIRGERLTLHVHANAGAPATLSELGLADDVAEGVGAALEEPSGVFLVSGPTRSGASTTLYSALAALNTPDRVVMSIEDPVERPTDGVDQVQVDEGAGLTFARGLRSILRAEPDVVLVSVLRDAETVEAVFEAARAGHVLLSAVPATTAAEAVTRLLATGVDPDLVANALTAVVSQRLVRRICPSCRESYYATESELRELEQVEDVRGPRLLARGRGCEACNHTGFRGRTAVFEVLPLTDEIRTLVSEQPSTRTLERRAVEAGMRTLRDDGIRLCLEGVTTTDEVRRVVGSAGR